jgi:hypothetical protein
MRKSELIIGCCLLCATIFSVQAQTNFHKGVAVTNAFYSGAGEWIKASNTNCLIWNSFPRGDESVTWSGGILNGKAHGKGIIQWFTNGTPTTSFHGEVHDGKSDGYGIAKDVDGTWVKGYWDQGSFKDGEGEEMLAGGVRYKGVIKNGRFNGRGEMIWPDDRKLSGEWKDSKLVGVGTLVFKEGGSMKVKQTSKGIERADE